MGRTMAELFADEGAAVVITARHAQQLNEVVDGIRAKGGKAVGVVADVCSTEDTKKVFETALREFGDGGHSHQQRRHRGTEDDR